MDIKQLGKELYSGLRRHSPEICIGLGITGFITGTVLAVKETPKAVKLLEQKKKELKTKKLPGVEIVKTTWKCYLPTVVIDTISIGCIIFADRQHLRRNAALATAYSLSEQAFSLYKEKVIETIGEKKEQEVRDEVAKERVKRSYSDAPEVAILGGGDTLCYLATTGQKFKGNIEKIRKAEAQLNKALYSDMYVSLNDFYEAIGLSCFTDLGNDIGWNIDSGPIEFEYSSMLDDNDIPMFVISFRIEPRADFRKLY